MRYSAKAAQLVFGCTIAVVCGVTACGGSSSTAKDPYLPPEHRASEKPIGEAPECVDEEDNPVKCEKDSECCQGFVCGKDPELNPREKFCIYAGG